MRLFPGGINPPPGARAVSCTRRRADSCRQLDRSAVGNRNGRCRADQSAGATHLIIDMWATISEVSYEAKTDPSSRSIDSPAPRNRGSRGRSSSTP